MNNFIVCVEAWRGESCGIGVEISPVDMEKDTIAGLESDISVLGTDCGSKMLLRWSV